MDGIGFSIALGAIRALAFIYDILTFPIYVLLQRPWQQRQHSRKIKPGKSAFCRCCLNIKVVELVDWD
ncbi:hypothetical protein D910_10455, partial [Dendroctonus ponderosae]